MAAVDGIETCAPYCEGCEAGLARTVRRKLDHKREEGAPHCRRLSTVAVVNTKLPVFWQGRFQKPDEAATAPRYPA